MRMKYTALFIILAVLVRTLIPAGFMPDMNSGKMFQMVICTAEGAKTVTMDDTFNPLSEKTPVPHEKAKSCDFSLTQINGAAMAWTSFAIVIFSFAMLLSVAVTQFPILQRVYRVAAPRGPPVSI